MKGDVPWWRCRIQHQHSHTAVVESTQKLGNNWEFTRWGLSQLPLLFFFFCCCIMLNLANIISEARKREWNGEGTGKHCGTCHVKRIDKPAGVKPGNWKHMCNLDAPVCTDYNKCQYTYDMKITHRCILLLILTIRQAIQLRPKSSRQKQKLLK